MGVFSKVKFSQLEATKRIDAEYYQPKYLAQEVKLKQLPQLPLRKEVDFITGPFGSEFIVRNYMIQSNYRYIRGKDVKPFFLQDDDDVHIPKSDFERLQKYALKSGDILISVVGTLGNTSIVNESTVPAIFSCKSTTVRTKGLNPYYLLAYLNSGFGKSFLLRRTRGTVQTGLNIDDLRTFPIFRPNTNLVEKISRAVKTAENLFASSKEKYAESEKLLLSELSLLDWKSKYKRSFVRRFSEVAQVRRTDAEYFQPKYDEIISTVKKFQPLRLSVHAEPVLKTVKFNSAELYRYIEIGDINTGTSEVAFTLRETKHLPANAKIEVKGGELLISKVRPTRGAIGIVPSECSDNGVASGAFAVYEIESPMREFLQVFLRSIVGKMQLEKPTKGTSYPVIENVDVNSVLIPSFDLSLTQEISDLVKQSHRARREAKRLLQLAKDAIETAIEQDEQTALAFLDENTKNNNEGNQVFNKSGYILD